MKKRTLFLLAFFAAFLTFSNAQKEPQIIEAGPPMRGANEPNSTGQKFTIPPDGDRFIKYREVNGLKGFQNERTGEWVIEPIYDEIDAPYQGKRVFVARRGEKAGLLDKKGKILLPFEFDQIAKPYSIERNGRDTVLFSHVFAQKNGLLGLFDFSGREVVPMEWTGCQWINGDHVLFEKKGVQRMLNWRAETVFEGHFQEFQWLEDQNFQTKRFFVATDSMGKKGLIDLRGRFVLPVEFLSFDWSAGNFVCGAKEQYGRLEVVNLQGRRVLPPRFGRIDPMPHGLFMARDFSTKKTGLLDSTGRVLVPFEYILAYVVGESGFIAARNQAELTAILDTSGRQLSEPIYSDDVRWNSETPNFLQVEMAEKKWRLIDRNGLTVIDSCNDFQFSPFAIIAQKGEFEAFFTPDGKAVTDFKYRFARRILTKKQERVLAKDVQLPADLTLLGSATNAEKEQVWIASDGREYRIWKK